MRLITLWLVLLICPLTASAGIFDDALNQVTKTAKNAYEKTVDKATGTADQTGEKSSDSQATKTTEPEPGASYQHASTGGKYIKLQDIPTDRRPATPSSIGLARLRYDQSWLDEKITLSLTEGVIYCQQNVIKTIGHWRGCLGERVYLNRIGEFETKVVPVFNPDEVDGKNRKFIAKANKDRLKPVLIDLANHLPPEFGNTLTWRGEYDFDNEVLKISIRNLEKAESYHLNRIPKHLKHMDVYKTPDRNFDGIRGEYYPMKAYIPEGLANGIIALVFDRSLSEGTVSMSATKAESLFKNQSGNSISGIAVVEFSVNKTEDNAAIATLEQVKILSAGEKIDLATAKPLMTIPASAFPKISAAAPATKTTTPSEPRPAPVQPKKAETGKIASDPYMRANTSKPFGPDVVDIKLGMSFDQADKLISKRKEVMKVIDGDPPRPFTRAKMYILKPGDEFIGLMTLKTTAGERIASVERNVYFHPNEAPSQTAIASSVEKKYAKPSYVYDVKGNFERSWYTDPQGNPTTKDGPETRACEYALTGSSPDVWLDHGKYYQWTMPWPNKTYMGVRAAPAVGSHKDLDKDFINECGPAIKIRYEDNSGMLTGPRLYIHLYDPAWVIAEYKKADAADAKHGAKDLAL